MLDNLLENAIIYSPNVGAIDVVVRSLVESDWIDRLPKGAASSFQETKAILLPTIPEIQKGVEISVRDCGIGIPDAHLERIFDRFHRVDTRLTREAGGLGLGLSIYKRIVETPWWADLSTE